jgi:Lon protease-like protein
MTRIPLFPLHAVLFPEMPIHLRVFEQRYQGMIGWCLQQRQPFGVVLIARGGEALGPLPKPRRVGCTAEIAEIEPLEEGEMNIKALGRQRFRIQSFEEEGGFLLAEVERLRMEPEPLSQIEARRDRLQPWVERYLALLAGFGKNLTESPDLPKDPVRLAHLSAGILQMPLDRKQALLSINTPTRLMDFVL